MRTELITNHQENNFYQELVNSFEGCKSFYFSVAFINYSGLQLLLEKLEEVKEKNIKGKIITTTYLNFTEPKCLEKLQEFDNIKTKIFIADSYKGFHTKGYIFEYEDYYKIIVGSSNITQSALKTNHEWNVKVYSKKDGLFIKDVIEEFNTLWDLTSEITVNFLDEYKKFLLELNDFVAKEKTIFEYHTEIKPNKMQIEAMENLERLRIKGANKALVISATGTGKTYMSAFDVFQFNPKRVLFIVHREKILDDAIKTYKRINHHINAGKFTGNIKEMNKDYLFASINTIHKDEYLRSIPVDYFDYIIIDEAHRAASMMYMKVIDYFQPKFLLGMTATPERLDNESIFDIFDNNVAVEIRLRDALKHDLVVPFHYFGITDITADLSDINIDEIDKVAERLNIKERVDFIEEKMKFYEHDGNKRKCLGFCVNTEHAHFMANEFNKKGYQSIALIGVEAIEEEREDAINRLEDNKDPLEFIFTVNIFNEGIDIPSVNLVLMLRPTQSPIIFTQQLGRGLRKHQEKEFLTVLDFIGNHKKTFLIPIALNGSRFYDQDSLKVLVDTEFNEIPGCTHIQLDRIAKEQILHQLDNVNFQSMKYMREEYAEFKRLYGNTIPKLMDYLHKDLAPDPIKFIDTPLTKSYIKFLSKVEEDEFIKNIVQNSDLGFLEFVSSFLPLRRIHEYVIMKSLFYNNKVTIEGIKLELSWYLDNVNEDTIKHAFTLLTNELYSDKEQLKLIPYLKIENESLMFTNEVLANLTEDYKHYLLDTINYGIDRYKLEFNTKDYGVPSFKLYERYQQADTLILSNVFGRSPSSVREGVVNINNDYFIFINLHKDEKTVKESQLYADEFLTQEILQWESQSTTSINSPTGQNLINIGNNQFKMHIFVRKYSKDKFYYLGTAKPIEHTGERPIRFKLKLDEQVPKNLYNDFTRIVK